VVDFLPKVKIEIVIAASLLERAMEGSSPCAHRQDRRWQDFRQRHGAGGGIRTGESGEAAI